MGTLMKNEGSHIVHTYVHTTIVVLSTSTSNLAESGNVLSLLLVSVMPFSFFADKKGPKLPLHDFAVFS